MNPVDHAGIVDGVIERLSGNLHPTSGYHHVTIANPGRLAFLAGQMPMDETGTQVVGVADLDRQVDVTVEHTLKALAIGGARPEDVVRSVVYVVGDQAAAARAWHRFAESSIGAAFTSASTLLGVAALGFPDQLVELELTAVLPPVG
jgi:enamine deaminase RidA (YjgF/YER057c/UK114 family)